MQLEAGKKYVDRRGRVYGPLSKDSMFFAEQYGCQLWYDDGRITPGRTFDMDLVSEYAEPPLGLALEKTPEYRLLTEGELIQSGDEYRAWDDRWEKAPDVGKKWTSRIYVPHRRLVKSEESKAVESPDDLVIQDRVPAREGVDFGWNVSLKDWDNYKPCESWKWDIEDSYAGRLHGSLGNIGRLAVFCRRKDLPPLPPKTRKVVLKEWICWDDAEPQVMTVWAAVDPSEDGADHAVETGNTREVEIPVT